VHFETTAEHTNPP